MIDDWFAEAPSPKSRHDAYTERLIAWGYLNEWGEVTWERRSQSLFQRSLKSWYLPAIKKELNRDLCPQIYGTSPWWLEPSRPASEDEDPIVVLANCSYGAE